MRRLNELISTDRIITCCHDLLEIHNEILDYNVKNLLGGIEQHMIHYRGEQCFDWELKTGIARVNLKYGKDPFVLHTKAVNLFEQKVHEKYGKDALIYKYAKYKFGREWDLIYQAQHAGIKTNLLDWTTSLEHSLFFASEYSENKDIENADGSIWILNAPKSIIRIVRTNEPYPHIADTINPFRNNNPGIYIVPFFWDGHEKRILETRMFKQDGRFFISDYKDFDLPMDEINGIENHMIKIKIPSKYKAGIREELKKIKLTRSKLFYEETDEMNNLIKEINNGVYG